MRRTSPIWIGLYLERQPLTPGAPLALTGPAGQSAPVIRDTGIAASTRPGSPSQDRSGLWLRNAAAGLCVLAAAAAAVSFTAQYRMVDATRHLPAIAALEAAIPDAAALVFACLGIALALHGRRALRARALNLASVARQRVHERDRRRAGLAEPGHLGHAPHRLRPGQRHLDRRRPRLGLARHQHLTAALAGEAATPLAVLGGLILWLLRLALAPASTLAGFRAWVLEECPVAPGRRAARPPAAAPARPGRGRGRSRGRRPRPPGSFLWSPNGTARSPPSPLIASPRSAPPWPQRRPEPRRRPRRPPQSRPRPPGTETPR